MSERVTGAKARATQSIQHPKIKCPRSNVCTIPRVLVYNTFKLEGAWVQGTPCPIYNYQVSLDTTNGEDVLSLVVAN